LASAFGIIKNHGGIIDFDSIAGEGTRFFIYLPVSTKRVDDAEEPPEYLRRGVETILLVDDEKYILNGCQSMLEKMGYTVMVASSGSEAVEIHQKNKSQIDLEILDMIMPDMDGRMAYEAIKVNDPQARVILSSGYSMENMAEGTIDSGCDGFIQKPYDLSQLSQKIRDVLNGTRQA
jgi:CheY-like chemotaxis protein